LERRGRRHFDFDCRGGWLWRRDLIGRLERALEGCFRIFVEERVEIVLRRACGPSLLLRNRLLLRRRRLKPRFAARGRGERHFSKTTLRASDVPMIGAVLDFAANPQPVLLKRVVALNDVLKLEALRRISDLDFAKRVNAPVDVLTGNRWLNLLDADEVLLVQGPQPFETRL
jgi:hypothetical protein